MEGGGVDGHMGNYNLFNTKLHTPDLHAIPRGTENQSRIASGMPPVPGGDTPATYDYPSFDIGIEATARSMVASTYQSRLITALTDKSVTADKFFEILTYYNRYAGNAAWAAASDPKSGGDPVKYLNGMLSVLSSVRADYQKYAGKALNDSSNAPPATGTGDASGCAATTPPATDLPVGDGLFITDKTVNFPGFDIALSRAKKIAVLRSSAFYIACKNDNHPNEYCKQHCDHLAGEVWGYTSSGYDSAKIHYQTLLAAGKIHKDRNPPAGALLFYESGDFGHIATYLGDGLLISNDVNDAKAGIIGGAYIVPTKAMEGDGWNLPYLGWSEPIFKGSVRSPSL